MSEKTEIELIEEVIDEFGVKRMKTRLREIVYKRFYICNFMRKHNVVKTLDEIATIVGYRKHDNVVYAIKQHENLKSDSLYQVINGELSVRLASIIPDKVKQKEEEEKEKTLEDRVLECKNYWEMVKLQEEIKKNN